MKIVWSRRAKNDFDRILDYLEKEWSITTAQKFILKTEKELQLISTIPKAFPMSKKKQIHQCIITRQITLFYKIHQHKISLITFFDTRQHPNKLNL